MGGDLDIDDVIRKSILLKNEEKLYISEIDFLSIQESKHLLEKQIKAHILLLYKELLTDAANMFDITPKAILWYTLYGEQGFEFKTEPEPTESHS